MTSECHIILLDGVLKGVGSVCFRLATLRSDLGLGDDIRDLLLLGAMDIGLCRVASVVLLSLVCLEHGFDIRVNG